MPLFTGLMKLSGTSRIHVLSELIVGLMKTRKQLSRSIRAVGIFMDDAHQLDDHSVMLLKAVSSRLQSDMFIICSSDSQATRIKPRLEQFWRHHPQKTKKEMMSLNGMPAEDLVKVIYCESARMMACPCHID